ncbi:MAG: DUF2513 domain-containing protein [Caldilineaceae bacterium]
MAKGDSVCTYKVVDSFRDRGWPFHLLLLLSVFAHVDSPKMKRNLDLVTESAAYHSGSAAGPGNVINVDGIRREVVYEHLYVMHQADLIEAVVHENGSNFDVMVYPIRLTWAGHEFIDTPPLRVPDGRWRKTSPPSWVASRL